jgi:hypothetical protein
MHVNAIMIPIVTIPCIGRGGIRGSGGGGEFKYDIVYSL